MSFLYDLDFIHRLPEIFLLLMLAIIFIQSGLDKVFNRQWNVDDLNKHFGKTPLKPFVPLLLSVVTVLETAAGFLSVVGVIQIMASGKTEWALLAAILSGMNFLALLFGQRMAKDYTGARTIVIHMIPTVMLVYLLLM